jgi:hypothetical protein
MSGADVTLARGAESRKPVAVHRVGFAGRGGGIHDLTWGQRSFLRRGQFLGSAAALSNVRHDEPMVGLRCASDVLSGISAVLRRYEALRTRFPVDPVAGWQQEILAEGELDVPEFSAAEREVDGTVAEVVDLLVGPAFGPEELPVRFALVTVDGVPARLVVAGHHPAIDGVSASIVCAEVSGSGPKPHGARATLAPGWQPRDIAAYECGPKGRDRTEQAVEYLRQQLRQTPSEVRGDRPRPTGRPTFVWAQLESAAVAAAAQVLAHRYAVSPAAVIFTGYATALARWRGSGTQTFQLACANRDHPRLRWSVANLFQVVPAFVDLTAVPFPEACRRVALASRAAYHHGWSDPDRCDMVFREIQRERRGAIALRYSVNLRYGVGEECTPPPGPAGDAREVLGRSRLQETRTPAAYPSRDVLFTLWALTDVARITLTADTTGMPEDRPASILRDLERILVDACDG